MAQWTKIKIASCIGGTTVKEDIEILKQGIHIIIATPGRTLDLVKRKAINLKSIKLFALDEADEMLDRGFRENIQEIFKGLPGNVQVALFSATWTNDILNLTEKFMRDPVRILVKNEDLTLEGISQ